jgi:hypothetical protein
VFDYVRPTGVVSNFADANVMLLLGSSLYS